jgi:hypothetical protein
MKNNQRCGILTESTAAEYGQHQLILFLLNHLPSSDGQQRLVLWTECTVAESGQHQLIPLLLNHLHSSESDGH